MDIAVAQLSIFPTLRQFPAIAPAFEAHLALVLNDTDGMNIPETSVGPAYGDHLHQR